MMTLASSLPRLLRSSVCSQTVPSIFKTPRILIVLRAASTTTSVGSAKPRTVHDYVIVGAGSAGCVLANRLSAPSPGKAQGSNSTVHILEAGPTDRGWSRWTIRMPAALMYNLYDDK